MKSIILFFSCIMINISFAGDHQGGVYTPNYCSEITINSCAHLKFKNKPTSTVEGEFIVHISSSNGSPVQDVDVKIWWDLGDGDGRFGAPVELESMNKLNHFHVQNAWFVMLGHWKVIINYTDAGVIQQIIIPIEIKE